jgi:hypothetical protein
MTLIFYIWIYLCHQKNQIRQIKAIFSGHKGNIHICHAKSPENYFKKNFHRVYGETFKNNSLSRSDEILSKYEPNEKKSRFYTNNTTFLIIRQKVSFYRININYDNCAQYFWITRIIGWNFFFSRSSNISKCFYWKFDHNE